MTTPLSKIIGRREMRDVAKSAGITLPTLTMYVTGQASPQHATLLRLARALDVPAGELSAAITQTREVAASQQVAP